MERFMSKVRKSDGCWEWTASKNADGYGAFKHSGKILAHRYSWEIHVGPIPEGAQVLHKCDNRACVNPDHLFLGNSHINVGDMVSKNRQAKGSRVSNSKLTDETVSEIRNRYANGEKQDLISREYGVTQGCISRVVNRHGWKHV